MVRGFSVGEVYGYFSIFLYYIRRVQHTTGLVAAENKLRMILSTVTAVWGSVHQNPDHGLYSSSSLTC